MSITWRYAVAEDALALARWNHQLIRDEGHRNPMTVPELEQRMRGWLDNGYKAVIYSTVTVMLGYALYLVERECIYLRQFFISPDQRRQGHGRACFQILRDEIWPEDVRLTVSVLCENTAGVAFWKAVGFSDYALTLEIMPGNR